MVKKKIIIPVFVLLLLIGIFFLVKSKFQTETIIEISFAHSFTGDKAEALQRQLRHYQHLNPLISIVEYFQDTQVLGNEIVQGTVVPDLFVWKGPVSRNITFSISEPFHWTGNLWTLVVNPFLLDSLTVERLNNLPDFEEFTQILSDIHSSGVVPLSVGNSHRWPLALWEQHLSASLSQSNDDLYVLPILTNSNMDQDEAWSVLQTWKKNGYFYDSVWDDGWARGLLAVSDGNAAIALMSGNMITTIPASKRFDFLYIPFPQSDINNRWIIGSGFSLIRNLDSDSIEEVTKLMEYLTSSAIAEIMTKEVKTLFYSTEQPSAQVYIPSWENMANNPSMREYSEALRTYVME